MKHDGDYPSLYTILYRALTGRELIDVLLEHPDFQSRGRRISHGIAGKSGDGEDLFQEMCLRVWRYGHALDPNNIRSESEFFSWLFVLALHAYRSQMRKKRLPLDETPIEEIFIADLRVNVEDECLRREFEEYVETLPDVRQFVINRWFEGFSLREIEEMLKQTGSTTSHVTLGAWVKKAIKNFFDRRSKRQ